MLSILSLYNYDSSIFDGFRVPDPLDKQTVIDYLCFELAELSLVYPEPETMKSAIKIWTDIHYKEWEDLEETLHYDYNPIWNVDGTETETHNLNLKRDRSGSDTSANSGTDTNTTKRASFNAATLQDVESNALQHGLSNTITYNSGDETKDTGTITRTRGGNIGVTKTQELIESQREVVQFTVTDFITRSFKRKFCVMTY